MERRYSVFTLFLIAALIVLPVVGCRLVQGGGDDAQPDQPQPNDLIQPAGDQAGAATNPNNPTVAQPGCPQQGVAPVSTDTRLLWTAPGADFRNCWWHCAVVAKGQTAFIPGFQMMNNGKLVWIKAVVDMMVCYSDKGVRFKEAHFIRPNGTKDRSGRYAQVVRIRSVEIRCGDKVFYVFDLTPVWDVITDPSQDIAFYMVGESPDGRYLVDGRYPMIDKTTFLPRVVMDSGGNPVRVVYETCFDSSCDVIAFPEAREYQGRETHNIVLRLNDRGIRRWAGR